MAKMKQFIGKLNSGYTSESLATPRFKSRTIPVLIDDVKQLDEFNMTRCNFFTINPIACVEDWVTILRSKAVPFLLFGISAVLYRPTKQTAQFLSTKSIDRLFHKIEEIDGLVVESEHIWLPNSLFKLNHQSFSPKAEQPYFQRGAVWRVNPTLFQLALLFQKELIDTMAFSDHCRIIGERDQALVEYSEEETDAFHTWSTEQINAAKENYERQREDPNRRVLEWVDEAGNRRPG